MTERLQISNFRIGDAFRCFSPGSFEGEILTVEEVHTDHLEVRSSLPRFSQTLIRIDQGHFDEWGKDVEVLPKEVFDRATHIIENGVEGTEAADWRENKFAA